MPNAGGRAVGAEMLGASHSAFEGLSACSALQRRTGVPRDILSSTRQLQPCGAALPAACLVGPAGCDPLRTFKRAGPDVRSAGKSGPVAAATTLACRGPLCGPMLVKTARGDERFRSSNARLTSRDTFRRGRIGAPSRVLGRTKRPWGHPELQDEVRRRHVRGHRSCQAPRIGRRPWIRTRTLPARVRGGAFVGRQPSGGQGSCIVSGVECVCQASERPCPGSASPCLKRVRGRGRSGRRRCDGPPCGRRN